MKKYIFLLIALFMIYSVSAVTWNSSFSNALVGYYGFNEGSGTNVYDSSGRSNGGIIQGTGYAWATGIVGSSVNLTGGDGFVNITNSTDFNFYRTMTINYWIRLNNVNSNKGVLRKGHFGANIEDFSAIYQTNTPNYLILKTTGGEPSVIGSAFTDVNQWAMITFTKNMTGLTTYRNGVIVGTYSDANTALPNVNSNQNLYVGAYWTGVPTFAFNGSVDEIGLWNRTLSDDEIIALYNGGAGLQNNGYITYNTPANNSVLTNDSVIFNCSSSMGLGAVNLTLYIDGVLNYTVTNTTGNQVNLSLQNTAKLAQSLHNYSCKSCDYFNNCVNGENITFRVSNYQVNSQTYQAYTTSGNTETFAIDINLSSGSVLTSANIIYNGTSYPGSINITGNNVVVTKVLNIPIVTTVQKVNFTWSFTIDEVVYNTSFLNQTINPIGIDNCTSYTFKILNFTLKDEKYQNLLSTDNSTIEITIYFFPVGSSTSIASYSSLYNGTNTGLVCINQTNIDSMNFTVNYQVRYVSTDYSAEFYNVQNYALTNSTPLRSFDLYDLATTQNTDFMVTYKDSNYIPVYNAIILVKRKYVSEGVYKDVEAPLTDRDGQAVVHLDRTGGVIYTIYVTKNGQLLSVYSDVAPVCQDVVISQCQINLNAGTSVSWINEYETVGNLSYRLNFTRANRRINLQFFKTDSVSSLIMLNVTKMDNYGNLSVCTNSLTASVGSFHCNITASYGNLTLLARLYMDGQLVTTEVYDLTPLPSDTFGYDGFILVLILLLTIPLMFVSSLVGMVIGIGIGLVLAIFLTIYNGGNIISSSSAIIWMIVAGGIIIYKLTSSRNAGGGE